MPKLKKACFVPSCNSTSENSNKLFLSLPVDVERRKNWFIAVGKSRIYQGHDAYCCEDHFDLPNDARNWMYYKMMGSKLLLKENVIPHRFISSPPVQTISSHLSDSDRKRKRDVQMSYSMLQSSTSQLSSESVKVVPSLNAQKLYIIEEQSVTPSAQSISAEVINLKSSEPLQVKNDCRCIGVQVSLKKRVRSVNVNTNIPFAKNVGTMTTKTSAKYLEKIGKIFRSRSKEVEEMKKEMREEMKEMMKGMLTEIKDLRRENREYQEEQDLLKQENQTMKLDIQNLQTRIDQLEETEQQLELTEKLKRRNNQLTTGFKTSAKLMEI